MQPSCLICDRIASIRNGTNPYVVGETRTSYIVIGDHQFFRGYTLVLSKKHAEELHELEREARTAFLEDMSEVAAAVYRAFEPKKLNYELLGNSDRHLHWHLIPRHADDPRPKNPAWVIDPMIRNGEQARPTAEVLERLKAELREQLPPAMRL